MRRTMCLCWVVASLLLPIGCKATKTQIKPPELPEEFIEPPRDDPRFSLPPQLPRDNKGPRKPEAEMEPFAPQGQGTPPRFGGSQSNGMQ